MMARKKYAIEEGYTAPPEYAERTYYPWNEVGVGGTFFIPKDKEVAVRSCRQNVYAANRRFEARGHVNRYRAWCEYEDEAKKVFKGMRIQRTQ